MIKMLFDAATTAQTDSDRDQAIGALRHRLVELGKVDRLASDLAVLSAAQSVIDDRAKNRS